MGKKKEMFCITATLYRDVYLEAENETDAKIKAEKIINDELAEQDGNYKIASIE